MVRGRAACAVALALATVAAGCGGAEHGNAQRSGDTGRGASTGTRAAEGATAGARPGRREAPDDASATGLFLPAYEFGDCIAFPPGGDERPARIVDCAKPHDIQMTVRIDGPNQDEFPARDDWQAFVAASCAAPAEALIGRPIDPFGRLTAVGVHPLEDGWARG